MYVCRSTSLIVLYISMYIACMHMPQHPTHSKAMYPSLYLCNSLPVHNQPLTCSQCTRARIDFNWKIVNFPCQHQHNQRLFVRMHVCKGVTHTTTPHHHNTSTQTHWYLLLVVLWVFRWVRACMRVGVYVCVWWACVCVYGMASALVAVCGVSG